MNAESPLVDVQSATQQRVITTEVVTQSRAEPMPASMVVLIPGISVSQGDGNYFGIGAHDVGGSVGDMTGVYAITGASCRTRVR